MRRKILLPLFAFSALLMAGENANDDKVKVTGCLTKAPSGEYVLTNSDGKKVFVMGSVNLEKHAANHKVTLHGTEKTTDGKTFLEVEKIDHVSNSCEAPTAQ